MNVLWIILIVVGAQLLPLSGNSPEQRLQCLDQYQLQRRAGTARSVLRVGRRVVVTVAVLVPMMLVALSSVVERSSVPSLVEFGVWCLLVAALRTRILQASHAVIATAKQRGVTLPPRRASATRRRRGLLLLGLAVALGAVAFAVGSIAGTSSTLEQAAVVGFGVSSALTFLAALIAVAAYYDDERSQAVSLPE